MRAGDARRIVKEGQVFSRIHVEDIARVLEASIARPDPGAVYNVCDNEAAPPMARSFYAESKRVSNRRMREELGVEPLYPSYREGLAALARDEGLTSDEA